MDGTTLKLYLKICFIPKYYVVLNSFLAITNLGIYPTSTSSVYMDF